MKFSQYEQKNEPLLDTKNIVFSPLHIDEAVYQSFNYIYLKFPALSEEKEKDGIFDGSQIRTLMRDTDFMIFMNDIEERARRAFCNVTQKFLGNKKAENYEEIVKVLLTRLRDLGCRISIKIHYLHKIGRAHV